MFSYITLSVPTSLLVILPTDTGNALDASVSYTAYLSGLTLQLPLLQVFQVPPLLEHDAESV